MNTIIEIDALSKRFEPPATWRRKKTEGITAVSPLTLTLPQGELFGLLGPNGAGKTTLVKMLCTLILPSSGQATVAGHTLDQAAAIRATVGLVLSDERSFYWRLSARRNLAFFATMYGLRGAKADERIKTVLQDVDLADVGKRPFGTFSSGMKQRLAIARGLLHEPKLLFLDEPSRSLDPIATQNLHTLIKKLMAEHGMTVFLITHDLAEAEKLCDRVGLMNKGILQTVGKPAELRRQLWRRRFYLLTVDKMPPDKVPSSSALDWHAERLENGRFQLSFWAEENGAELTAVLNYLQQHQAHIYTIEATPPTLEDVFLSLQEKEIPALAD